MRRRSGSEELVFRMLTGLLQRLKGLLGTGADAPQVALVRCGHIHTFGMRYRIDVAFVSKSGMVLEAWRSVPPGQLLGNRRAWVTFERPHCRTDWLTAGEVVEMDVAS